MSRKQHRMLARIIIAAVMTVALVLAYLTGCVRGIGCS